MKLNLYKICTDDLSVGNIRVLFDDILRRELKNTILLLNSKRKLNEISHYLGLDYTTLWDYCNRRKSVPLNVLKKLEHLSKKSFSQSSFRFVCGQQKKKVNLPLKMDLNLAKIVGCIIADGHLKIRSSKRGNHFELVIREGYESNVTAFSEWFRTIFGLKLEPKKVNNHYYIYVSNKIIVSFLTLVIGLPTGRKADYISIPKLFWNSSLKIKKALLQGIFMFDGGVDHATGYVSLTTRSENLFNDVSALLSEIGIEPDYVSNREDKFKRWKLVIRRKEKLKYCLLLFEAKSVKYCRLQDHLEGFHIKTANISDLYVTLDKYYPRTRKSSLSFTDVIKAVEDLKKANMPQICKKLKKGSTTVQAYLSKLTGWKILQSQRIGLQKYWGLNDTFYPPRRIHNGRENGRKGY